MIGTALNTGAVVLGAAAGLALGARVPARVRDTLTDGVGLVVLVLGLQMALKTENALVVLLAIVLGGTAGALLRLDDLLERLAEALKRRVGGSAWPRFTEGFVGASLVFCVGPMAILGAISDGLRGDYSILAVKSVLDGVTALAFASTMGAGVLFSAVTVLLYQGGVTLLAGLASSVLSEPMIAEMTATGGVMVLGIGLRLLQVKQVPVAAFIPALAVAPVLVGLM